MSEEMSITDVLKTVTKGDLLTVDQEAGLIIILVRDAAKHGDEMVDRAYRIIPPGDTCEELDIKKIVGELTTMIEGALDVRHFLQDVLLTSYPGAVIAAHERLKANPEIAKAIKPKGGCYMLSIPAAKEGDLPIEIMLR